MSARATLATGITVANRELFLSECTVARPGAQTGELNETTGRRESTPATEVYDGPCWIKLEARVSNQRNETVGGDGVVLQRPFVALPMSAPLLRTGDRITITASPSPINVGRVLTVTGLPGGDFIVAARYQVEGITG